MTTIKSSITFASNGGRAAALILILVTFALPAHAAADAYKLNRTVLPIAEPKRAPITELDVRKAKAPPGFEVKASKGAPNVVIVLLDDLGFAHRSTFGGAIAMPTLDRLAGCNASAGDCADARTVRS